jgi:outer membrane protein OmpA-like peptidoglycan-associated protein
MRWLLIFLLVHSLHTLAQDTVAVYFGPNETVIDNHIASRIDSLINAGALKSGRQIALLGYADYVGNDTFDDTMSATRARAVRDFLIIRNVPAENIVETKGMGRLETGSTSAGGRKVLIVMDKRRPPDTLHRATTHRSVAQLSDLQVNQTLALNLFFYPGSHHMKETSYPDLEKLYGELRDHPSIKIQIEGHVCCVPRIGNSAEDGEDLETDSDLDSLADSANWNRSMLHGMSFNRAKVVYEYLVSKGVDPARMTYIGLGNGDPLVYPEYTEEDKIRNRRVEIRVLEK